MACAALAGAAALVGHKSSGGGSRIELLAVARARSLEGRQQRTQMLLRHEWNNNEEYWRPTPLDIGSPTSHLAKRPSPSFRLDTHGIENRDDRKLERDHGIIVDSFGPAESVASSRPEPDHDFNVRQINNEFDVHANARHVEARHGHGDKPLPPPAVQSDQFLNEHISTSGLVPHATSPEVIQGAGGEDEYVAVSHARNGIYSSTYSPSDFGGGIEAQTLQTFSTYPRPEGRSLPHEEGEEHHAAHEVPAAHLQDAGHAEAEQAHHH